MASKSCYSVGFIPHHTKCFQCICLNQSSFLYPLQSMDTNKHFKSVVYWKYFSCQENIRVFLAHKTEIQKTLSGVLEDNLYI